MDINISPGSSESVIQNAINTVSQSGGGNVNLPAGTFVISNGLAMWSNVALSGVGPATILQAPSTPSGVAIIYNPAEGLSNISVSNLVIDGHIPRSADFYGIGTPAPFQASGIYFFCYNSPCVNVVFSNVEIKNTSHGALIGGCDLFTFTHCNFHDNGDGFSHNVYFRSCSSMEMDHCKVDYSTIGDGLHIAGGGGGFTINKCQFVGNSGLGLLVQDNPQGLTLTNTLVESSYNHGIELNCYSTNISQDRFDYNDGYGILVDDPSSGIMAYNYYVNNSYDLFFDYDLSVGPFNTSYAGNVYEAEAADGITGPADTGDWITTYSGFSGLGAVDFNTNHATNGTLTWPAVTAQTAKSYPLVFGYSNGLSTTTSLALSINGVSAGTISFPPTGSWSTWKSVTVNANLLGKGNAVTLSVVPGTSAPLIDNMTVTAPTPASPPAPTGVTATAVSSQQINLSWNPVPGCYYQIQRVYPQGNLEVIATNITGTTYSDSHLLYGGSNYNYIVVAVSAGGDASSATVTGTTLIGAPAWAIATGQTKQVALQVLATQGAATYNVKRSTTSGGPYTIIGNFPNIGSLGGNTVYSSYTDTNVTVGVKYYYVFTGVNGSSESGPSLEVSAIPMAVVAPNANTSSVATTINTAVAFTLSATDPNNPAQPLTYTVTTAPLHGTLSGTAPALTYTPVAGYYGTDSFQFKVNNGTLSSNVATVTINIDPTNLINGSFETPSLGAGGFANNPTGGGWMFAGNSGIQSNGTSVTTPPNAPDGVQSAWIGNYQGVLGTISQSVTFPSAGIYTMSFQSANWVNEGGPQPLQFSVDGINVGSPLTPASTNFAPQTTASFGLSTGGTHTIALAATSNNGFDISMIDLVYFAQISTTPFKPTANSLSVSTGLSTPVSVTLSGADTNIPAAPLTYAVTTAPAHGTLSGTAPNLTYTPATGYFGSDSFQYKVNNGVSDSAIATVSITVTATVSLTNGSFETPSVASSNGFAFSPTGSGWTFSGDSGIQSNGNQIIYPPNAPDGSQTAFIECYPGTSTGSISQSISFPSAGTYKLSFQAAAAANGAEPIQLSVDGVAVGTPLLPGSASFGLLTSSIFTIKSSGAHTITLTGTGGSRTLITLIDVVSITGISIILPPTATAQSVTTNLNTAALVTLTGSDANTPALPLTYSVTTAPLHGTLSGTAPNLTYTPTTGYTGSDSFQFKVSNGTLSSSAATVSITVNNASGIINGSFETPSVGTANYQYNPTGGTWAFLGDSGIQSNGSGWGVPNAPDGTQTAFLNGNPNRGTGFLGAISQNVNFATTGTYVVSFQAAQRYGQVQPLKLSVDGVQVGGLLTPTSSAFGALTSGVFTINTTGSHTITISATATTSDLTTMVDSVTITPVTVATSSFANSSFETPSVGTANYQYSPTGASWTFLGDSGIQSNGSGWGVPNAPDGTQTAFLNGNPNRGTGNLGGISQSVNFASTGTYVVSFQAAQRYGQVQPLKLTVDGVQVGGLLTPTSSSFGTLTSGVFSISTTGLHTITISATATTSDLTTVVDSVTLTPVTVATSSFANSSFETPSVGTASYQYSPSGTSWTFLGDSGIQSNGSGWGVPNAPDGTQTAFLNGNPNRGTGNLGGISQSVNFASTGNYTISFQAAQRYGQVQPLKLTVDGVQVGGLLTPTSSAFGTLTSGVFTINTVGLHTITLSATATTSDLTSMVDQMAISTSR